MTKKICEYRKEDGELEWIIQDRNEYIQIAEYYTECDTANWIELLPKGLIKKIYKNIDERSSDKNE